MVNVNSGVPRSFQHQAIQRQTREDCDWVPHAELSPLARRTYQFAMFNGVAFRACLGKKRITLQRFVSESAAAGLFPSQPFVKENDISAALCEQCARESPSRTASDNRYGVRLAHSNLLTRGSPIWTRYRFSAQGAYTGGTSPLCAGARPPRGG